VPDADVFAGRSDVVVVLDDHDASVVDDLDGGCDDDVHDASVHHDVDGQADDDRAGDDDDGAGDDDDDAGHDDVDGEADDDDPPATHDNDGDDDARPLSTTGVGSSAAAGPTTP
jgi:hypothetical protein